MPMVIHGRQVYKNPPALASARKKSLTMPADHDKAGHAQRNRSPSRPGQKDGNCLGIRAAALVGYQTYNDSTKTSSQAPAPVSARVRELFQRQPSSLVTSTRSPWRCTMLPGRMDLS